MDFKVSKARSSQMGLHEFYYWWVIKENDFFVLVEWLVTFELLFNLTFALDLLQHLSVLLKGVYGILERSTGGHF